MKPNSPCILAINLGSSSIRFSIYDAKEPLSIKLSGKMDRVGTSGTTLTITDGEEKSIIHPELPTQSPESAVDFIINWLESHPYFTSITAVGHRVVHGMKHSKPERITAQLIAELHRLTSYDPEHLPQEINLIERIQAKHPTLLQVACFDTAFHRTMPPVARLLPIPRRYSENGIERYGFHGLSYSFLMEELARLDPQAAKGRVILAHLGNGASLAAVMNGKSIDTSMGFTPAAGLIMSTRSGDIDPGLVNYLMGKENMTPAGFQKMVNEECGLLGVSETSSDVRELLANEGTDSRAEDALSLFCYQAKKWIGSFTAALGGLDTLIFTGGIGENSPVIRERICLGLEFLGIGIDSGRNSMNLPLISTNGGRVCIRMIRTDEELMIARSTFRICSLETDSN